MYKPLNRDPRWNIEKQILSVLKPALEKVLIYSDLLYFLYEKHPKTLVLSLLPKIHKALRNSPGRPIVSKRRYILNKINFFLDRVLREYAIQTKSYIKDMSDFLLKIALLTIPEDFILASFDVVSLYTSIDHVRGTDVVKKAIDKSDLSIICKNFIIDLLTLYLTCNYFTFDNQIYMQSRSTAMGANVAPIYANIFG